MRSTSPLLLIALLIGLTINCAHAEEIQRLQVDLDGDGAPDLVLLSTSKAKDDWRKRLTVEISKSKYSDEYFAAEGDIPDIRVISIDRKRREHQLLVGTPEAGSCVFHLLSSTSKRLSLLLRFDSGPNCVPPTPLGNGKVSISTWQGFWNKDDTYRLTSDGRALVLEEQEKYFVNASGSAGNGLTLQGATCPMRAITPGTFIRVKLFDPKANRYFLEAADGGCGWIPADEVNTPEEKLLNLPWAG
jgi:hypothetical protein